MIIASDPRARNPYPYLFGDDVSVDTRPQYSMAPRSLAPSTGQIVETGPSPETGLRPQTTDEPAPNGGGQEPGIQTAPPPPPPEPQLPTAYGPQPSGQYVPDVKRGWPWWAWVLIAGGITGVGLVSYKLIKG